MNIAWAGLADKKYYEYIAKYCLPSWGNLPGEKFLVTDDISLPIDYLQLIDYNSIENKNSKFLAGSKKVHGFWRKMQSQVWAVKNLQSYDFVVLLDTDIEIIEFNNSEFERILNEFKESNLVWATGRSQRRGHDSGFIIFNMKHSDRIPLINAYENIWESGEIASLNKAYDGNAVEQLLETTPSYKIKNNDCGKGLHHYKELGMVHWGSKEPKEQRSNAASGKELLEQRLSNIVIKKFKNQ
jgi:hypothetical protein